MVSMAENRTLSEVLVSIVNGIAGCRNCVLARIWLLAPGDLCEQCHFREECPDQTRCLHLVASAGNPVDPRTNYRRTDGSFRRFPLGVRKVGKVAATGEPLHLSGMPGDEVWIADIGWVQREGVETIAAQPLVFRGEVLGVLAVFDRGTLEIDDFEWLRVFADHAAVSIANARAFEEIEYLQARLEEENQYLRQEVDVALGIGGLVGDGPALREVIKQVQLVAPTDSAVLVTGESGTGKELVARAIHDQSQRKDGPLIRVNCGAIPENLFESEFFGHVKGAFTGATRDKAGRFELADGGTLFLDEVGEIPLAQQAKLLRVLQEHELERVGETRVRSVNVRVIAATNRNLEEAVAEGTFREDLFYRLNVVPISVPPLRDRAEDIPLLVQHFVAQTAQRLNRPPSKVTEASVQQLREHRWPGNIRELQNVIERAVILSGGGTLKFDLPGTPVKSRGRGRSAKGGGIMTKAQMREQERETLIAALTETKGKVFGDGGAAELLQMRPTTLASRIQALGIDRKAVASAAKKS